MLLKKIQNRKKELIIRLIAVLFAVTYIVVGNRIACSGLQDLTQSGVTYYEAKVVAVQDRSEETVEISDAQTVQVVTIRFTAELLDGEQKGEHVSAQQQSDPFYAVPLQEVKAGDRILMVPVENGSEEETVVWQYHGHVKTDALIVLAVLFVICLLIFGRGKGFTTLLCLGFTVLAIFVVFVPAILSGQNIYLWTVITSVYIVAVTLLVVYGADRLSATAGIGCVCGVLVSAGMTVLMVKVMNLTGMVDDDSMYLQMLNPVHPIDLKAIIFAAITIGAIGAIMDVSMSVSASLLELKRKAPQLSLPTLFRSGITIGRDMMGTMANTLVLAYIGSSLSLVLLLYAANTSLLTLFNREMIIIEVLQALVGSFGILLTIPLTSLVGSFIYTRDETSFWGIWKRKRKKQIPEHTDVSPGSFGRDRAGGKDKS